MTATVTAALAPLRARKGQRRTPGLDDATLERIASGWTEWGTSPDALFVVPSAELIARKAA